MSKMTIIGIYKWLLAQRPSQDLFEGMSLPSGLDRDTLINNILLRSSEFEIVYPDPTIFKSAITFWSSKWQRTIEKWYNALQLEYEPIENYDRKEEWEDTGSSSDTTSGTTNSKTDGKVSAYNSSTMQPNTETDNETSSTALGTTSMSNKRVGRAHGNIGVTTSQQMLREEYSIAEWNIYEHITDLFLMEFTVPVY